MTSYRALARNRDFTVLWTGETVSELGTSVSVFVLPLLGYALTGSAALAALAEGAYLLGLVLMLLPSGVLADRVDRRRLMLVSSGSGALLYAVLATLTFTGALTLPLLVLGAFVTGVGAGLFGPAEMAAIRTVVPREDLPTALSQNQARQHVAGLVGGPLGGLLLGLGRAVPFATNAVTYLVSCLTLSRLRADLRPPATERSSVRADLRDGARFIARRPLFRWLLVYGAASNLVVNTVFTIAVLRMVTAGVDPVAIGLVETCAGVGGIVGAVAAPWLVDRIPTGRLTVLVGWSWLPLVLPLAFTADPRVVGACVGAGLLLNPAGNAAMGSYRVAVTPPALQGRVTSTMQFCSMALMPLAPVLGGVLLHAWGAGPATFVLMGCIAAAATVPTLCRPIRSVPRPADWPTVPPVPPVPPEPATPAPEPATV